MALVAATPLGLAFRVGSDPVFVVCVPYCWLLCSSLYLLIIREIVEVSAQRIGAGIWKTR